jgi:hypothetical protein
VVNGRVAGVLPLAAALKLPARQAEVVVRAPGYTEQRQLVPIAGGQRHDVTANLEKIEQPAPPAPVVIPTAAPPPASVPAPAAPAAPAAVVVDEQTTATGASGSSSNLRTSAWIVGGGAVVAAGAGLALNLVANSKSAHFDADCKNSPTTGITPVSGVTPADCQDRYDTWHSYRTWSLVGYASGAALAVTSSVLFWISRPTPTAATTHAGLTCAPEPNGISCRTIF